MISPVRIPLLTIFYSLLGLILALLWYRDHEWVVVTVALTALVVACTAPWFADKRITKQPLVALKIFEWLGVVTGIMSGVVACVTVLITVYLAGLGGDAEPNKELFATLTSALTTLLTGLVVSVKDSDEALGKFIKKRFSDRFVVEGAAKKSGQVALKQDSLALTALRTSYANGWTDWDKDNRLARIKSLAANLDASRA